MCSTPGASALGEGFCLCGRGLLPLRSERASASTGEGFCLCGRGLLPLRSERASAWLGVLPAVVLGTVSASTLGEGFLRRTFACWLGVLPAVVLGTVVPSVITTVGADAVALAAEALAVSEGAAWSGMMLTGKVLAKWCTEEGAEVARPAVELATVVSKETGGSAVEGEMARRPAAAAAAVGRRVADVEAMLAAVWCAGGTEPIVSKMTDDEVVGLTERVLDAQWMDSV